MTTFADLMSALERIEDAVDKYADPNSVVGANELMGVIVDCQPTLSGEVEFGHVIREKIAAICILCDAYRAATTAAQGELADGPNWRLVHKHARVLRQQIKELLPLIEQMSM